MADKLWNILYSIKDAAYLCVCFLTLVDCFFIFLDTAACDAEHLC
jgi:hypothetical protein